MENPDTTPHVPTTSEARSLVLKRYEELIRYYRSASECNKRSYKATRYLITVLGALVTLVASLSSAKFITGTLGIVFAVFTPVLAASLAIVSGVSQAFQWGAVWSDMVITATRLEGDRDRIAVTPIAQFDSVKEMALLGDTVLAETEGFFQRLFGAGGPSKSNLKSL